MPKKSAGFLLFRRVSGHLEVFLVHPGGPFWAKKDEGAGPPQGGQRHSPRLQKGLSYLVAADIT